MPLKNKSFDWAQQVSLKIPLRLRLTLLFGFLFGAFTFGFNFFIFLQMTDTLQKDFDDALFNYAIDVSDSIKIGKRGDLKFPPVEIDDGKILPFPLGTALIQVVHRSGQTLFRRGYFGSFDPPYRKDFSTIAEGQDSTFRTLVHEEQIPNAEASSYRMISFPLEEERPNQLLLQIAVPMTLLETQIQNRLHILQWGLPLLLLFASLVGFFVSTRALKPVTELIEATQNMKASELGTRLPVPEAEDEIQKLALTLNEMLGRIEKAFLSQERFVADASHQLLTPVTLIKNELEASLKSAPENLMPAFKSLLNEVDYLARIIREMLLLARIDAGLGALNLQNLALDEIILNAVARLEKVAQRKMVKIQFKMHPFQNPSNQILPIILGDYDLVQHMIFNLVENAIKYSNSESTVVINLEWTETESTFRINNDGPGIASDIMPNLFDRFARGAQSSQMTAGFGLGLAISQKIAQLHNTQIKAQNTPTGAQFELQIKNI